MKTTILITLFAILSTLCFGIVQLGIGLDFAGDHKMDSEWNGNTSEDSWDTAMGIDASLEFLTKSNNILYGVGAEYQVQREVDFPNGEGKMGFIPIYGVLRFQVPVQVNFTPELIANAGYNLFTGDDDYKGDAKLTGGLYWGIGAGVNVQNFIIQLMYKTNYGKIEQEILGSTFEGDITNTQINLTVGMRF
jgi:hypothetical protein